MKRLIYLAILGSVMCFTSCGSHKSNLREQSSVSTSIEQIRKDTASASQSVYKTESERSTEETEEVKTEYDTDKPTDPITGKHPIKSETKKTTKKETGKKVDEVIDTKQNQSSEEQISAKEKEDAVKVEDKQKEETTVPKQMAGLVWALVVLVALVIVGWLIIRYRQEMIKK